MPVTLGDIQTWGRLAATAACRHHGDADRGWCPWHHETHCQFCCGHRTALDEVGDLLAKLEEKS